MIVGVIRLDLQLHGTRSLKEKRSVLKRLMHHLRSVYPVSIAETGHQDLLQRAVLGATLVSTSEAIISRVFSELEAAIEKNGTVAIVHTEVEYLHYGEQFS